VEEKSESLKVMDAQIAEMKRMEEGFRKREEDVKKREEALKNKSSK